MTIIILVYQFKKNHYTFFTESCKTSDFIVDGLFLWWNKRKQDLSDIKNLVINMDNCPEFSGRRTRFLQRMIGFADETGLIIRLITASITQSNVTGLDLKNHGTDICLIQRI